jgi:hypothetical protein
MPFTGNKSPGAKKGSDEWHSDNINNIFWVKRTFTRDVLVFMLYGYTVNINQDFFFNSGSQNQNSIWITSVCNIYWIVKWLKNPNNTTTNKFLKF